MATAKKAAPKKKAAAATKPATPEEAPAHDREVTPVKPGDVKLENMMHQQWACFAPSDYSKDQVENPKFWTFMAPKFKDLDEIRITAEDGSWIAKAYIRKTMSMELFIQVYDWVELEAPQLAKEIEVSGYLIRHLGLVRMFCVHNKATGQLVKEGFRTQMDAMKYVTDHIQAA